MCFITAGMGGGTGTGAAPIIAQAARELGVLTVGVVTKPFQFEGAKRMRQAEDGVDALQKVVDTLIIIPNQNLFRLANERTTFTEAFALADDVLYQGVKGVTDLMVRPGLINLDFADVRAVMDEMGKAMMGTGEAEGDNRAVEAAEKAIANPLLDEISLEGAKGVLINITGGHDLTLFELDEAANKIREKVDPDANIIVGSTLERAMEGRMRVSVVATGIDAAESRADVPLPRRSMARPLREQVAAEAPARRAGAARGPAGRGRAGAAARRAASPQRREPRRRADRRTRGQQAPSLFDDGADARGSATRGAGRLSPRSTPTLTTLTGRLPPPAYRPRPEPAFAEDPATFVAPKRPVPGTPSPEALARLRAAVQKAPDQRGRTGCATCGGRRRSGQRASPALRDQFADQPDDRPRRSGTGAPAAAGARRPSGAEPAAEGEEERIEIPAFLRRQAN